jgi:muramoyltetrapeptide carboxypeptidase
MMHKPTRLAPGDRVRIVLPASPVRPEMFQQGIALMRSIGLEPVHGDIRRKWRYLAGEDPTRRAELVEALSDSESKAIFFARGGYGSSRLLTDLNQLKGSYQPKILLGCSDITTLHLYFQRIHQWVVFHGPMVSGDFARDQAHLPSLQQTMFQTEPYSLAPDAVQILRGGKAEGILTGGCLTLLEAAVGTPWEPDWTDSILFLEDVSVKPYQMDRMLTHLKILNKFDKVRAFVFGEMKDCIQVENQGYTIQEVILDLLSEFGKPIFFNFPSGHVSGLNWTLPLGVRARISDHPFRLDVLEPAVR